MKVSQCGLQYRGSKISGDTAQNQNTQKGNQHGSPRCKACDHKVQAPPPSKWNPRVTCALGGFPAPMQLNF